MEYLLQSLIRSVERKFCPRAHAELRPSAVFLLGVLGLAIGMPVLFVGFFGLNGPPLPGNIVPGFAIVIISLVTISLFWRYRLHFRQHSVFIYRFGRLTRVERYVDIERVKLGPIGAPLQIVRKDGSIWNLPSPDDESSEVRGELLWQLERSGVLIPEKISRLNRFGIGDLKDYSRSVFREQRGSNEMKQPSPTP